VKSTKYISHPAEQPAMLATAEAANEHDTTAFASDSSIDGIDPTAKKLIPAVQAAQLFHRTTRTLRNWEARGLLPGLRIGRSLYFKLSDIELLIAGGEAFETAPQSPPISSRDENSLPTGSTYHDTNFRDDGAT
jgi:hypothetical protein